MILPAAPACCVCGQAFWATRSDIKITRYYTYYLDLSSVKPR